MVEWLKTEFKGSSCLDLSNTDYKCILYHAWFLTWVPGIELRSSCVWKICISDWASPQLHIRSLVHLHTCSVCLHECSCVHVCILMHMSMCRPEIDVRCHPQSLCTSLLIQSLFLAMNSLVLLDGLVTWFQILPSPFPAVGLCAHAPMYDIFCGLWQCKFSCLYGTTFQPEPRPSFWLEEGKMDWPGWLWWPGSLERHSLKTGKVSPTPVNADKADWLPWLPRLRRCPWSIVFQRTE